MILKYEVRHSMYHTLFFLTFIHLPLNQIGSALGHTSTSLKRLCIHPEDVGKVKITKIPKVRHTPPHGNKECEWRPSQLTLYHTPVLQHLQSLYCSVNVSWKTVSFFVSPPLFSSSGKIYSSSPSSVSRLRLMGEAFFDFDFPAVNGH